MGKTFPVAAAKLASLAIKGLRLGSGATWPGEIGLRLNPKLLNELVSADKKIILVAGTNGKTTTAKMLRHILEQTRQANIVTNDSGANLLNGIVASVIDNSSWSGQTTADYYIFETDEANLSRAIEFLTPSIIVLLNLFRDQLDRYGEVDTIVANWQHTLANPKLKNTTLIVNGDDPQLAWLGENTKEFIKSIFYFGLGNASLGKKELDHATDSVYCPSCGEKLKFAHSYFSHLGSWSCPHCTFKQPVLSLTTLNAKSPLEGLYNHYNTLAAILTASQLDVPTSEAINALETFKPAFGRLEEIDYQGKRVKIILSKNPAGFNASLQAVITSRNLGPVLLALNDQAPDGRDVSWIWDVNFDQLKERQEPIIVSGERAYDLGIRLKYTSLPLTIFEIIPDLPEALQAALDKTKSNETLWVLPTYSAMLNVREVLTGRKIL